MIAAPRMRHFHLRAGSVSRVHSASIRSDEAVEHRAVAPAVVRLERQNAQAAHARRVIPAAHVLDALQPGSPTGVGQRFGGRYAGAAEVDPLERGERVAHHPRRRRERPTPRARPGAWRASRVARHEQRAAVVVRLDRQLVRPDPRASAMISSLSLPISGRSTGRDAASSTAAMFSSVWDAT